MFFILVFNTGQIDRCAKPGIHTMLVILVLKKNVEELYTYIYIQLVYSVYQLSILRNIFQLSLLKNILIVIIFRILYYESHNNDVCNHNH